MSQASIDHCDWPAFYASLREFESHLLQPNAFRSVLPEAPRNRQGELAQTHLLVWSDSRELDLFSSSRPVLLCAGGIVNTAWRFSILAQSMSQHFDVIAFDWYGRGHSDWLVRQSDYTFQTNVRQLQGLLKVLEGREIHFLGSSLGGVVAMALAERQQLPFESLILNDIGPEMQSSRRTRRAQALVKPRQFPNPSSLRAKVGVAEKNSGHIPTIIQDFLARKNTLWCHQSQARIYRYDLACMYQYALESNQDINLWRAWQSIRCPQLLIHGLLSDALAQPVIERMQHVNPELQVFSVPDAGHTPSLCTAAQVQGVGHWLESLQPKKDPLTL